MSSLEQLTDSYRKAAAEEIAANAQVDRLTGELKDARERSINAYNVANRCAEMLLEFVATPPP